MNTKPIYACIDLGSNMCRMLIARQDLSKSCRFTIIRCFSSLIYIGKNSKNIDEKGLQRILKALGKCKQILETFPEHNISVSCIATAIFRSSDNSEEILNIIEKELGFKFTICPPNEEILLSAYGCIKSFKNQYSFIIDMGGGSTEVGLCSRTKEEIKLLHWISFPYGLFYFGKNTDLSKVVSDQTKILMNGFVQKCNEIIQKPVPFIISRSGIMSTLSKYISHKMNDSKFGNYNKMIDLSKAIESIKDIINIQNNNKLNIKFLNRTHLKSMRGSFFFTLFIMESLPINSLVLNNGGVKEGMMFLAARNKLFV